MRQDLNNKPRKLVRGDLVEVRSAEEILETLDEKGALDNLPFMPEMLDSLGKRFRVHRRVEHFTIDGASLCEGESAVRSLTGDDVVILEAMRCSGQSHGGCKRGCMIFWKESWLSPVAKDSPVASPGNLELLSERLVTKSDPEKFYCQSSQLVKASVHLGWKERILKCIRNVRSGNYSFLEMVRNLLVWFRCRIGDKVFGIFPTGTLKKTPSESLDLQEGELVEVKTLAEITKTLDANGCNRGLHFSREMIPYCGRQLKVLAKADRMIAEGSGIMRKMRNTVILENSVCDSATWAFGACPREDHIYWREIWLKRICK